MSLEDPLRAQVREIVLRILQENSPARNPLSLALGADQGGFELKQNLVQFLSTRGYPVVDCGAFSPEPVDYPDIAYAVAKLVSDGAVDRGIIVDGAGIGSAMTANKVPGIRAAMCYDAGSTRNAREHNNANVLTLGGRLIKADTAHELVTIFLDTACTEARHQKRVAKIMEVERRYLRK